MRDSEAISHLEDAELARRVLEAPPAQARDEEGELCRRFAPRLRRYGLRHLKDEPRAADLVQRALVLTIEKLRAGEVREPERIASFVLGVARMTAREMFRSGQREEPREAESLPVQVSATSAPEPLGRERLARCLEGLSERERTVVVLTFYQERSAKEIAAALEIREGNVRVIRHRAIDKLRACIGWEKEEGVS